ncbi:hypothetical protein M9Y10_036790 [Tritrichomonas musculus]|uniref:Uncharacterized protein n=1 Tax=Tritrichomonas musculus TaxID=1915356 RepID=A0ABR2GUV1_9EUKA
MITLGQDALNIRATGSTANVPNHPMARLMYYLRTVNSLIDFDIPYDLRDYSNYDSLSFDEENQVLMLSTLLSPDLFIEKGIMINEPRLCPNCNNEFYEISAIQSRVAVTQEFVVGGKRVRTLEIMAFKPIWLESNYIAPIKAYMGRIRALANGTVDQYRPVEITYRNTKNNCSVLNDEDYSKHHSKCCLLI